jgi:hypothetical protein
VIDENVMYPLTLTFSSRGEGIRREDIWFKDLWVMLKPSKCEGLSGKKLLSSNGKDILITG